MYLPLPSSSNTFAHHSKSKIIQFSLFPYIKNLNQPSPLDATGRVTFELIHDYTNLSFHEFIHHVWLSTRFNNPIADHNIKRTKDTNLFWFIFQ